MLFLILYIAVAAYILLGFAFTCAIIAEKRGGDGGSWFFAGLFFTVFALVIVLALPPKPRKAD